MTRLVGVYSMERVFFFIYLFSSAMVSLCLLPPFCLLPSHESINKSILTCTVPLGVRRTRQSRPGRTGLKSCVLRQMALDWQIQPGPDDRSYREENPQLYYEEYKAIMGLTYFLVPGRVSPAKFALCTYSSSPLTSEIDYTWSDNLEHPGQVAYTLEHGYVDVNVRAVVKYMHPNKGMM